MTNNISNRRLAIFASPAAAGSAAHLPLILYIPPYYATDLGFGLAYIGFIFGLTKVWDVVTDPIAGILSDRFSSRWGRRKLWMGLGAPLMFIGALMLFFPERLITAGDVSAAYLIFSLLALYTGFTLFTINHTAWGAELSGRYHERSKIQGYLAMATLAGGFIVMAAPAAIEQLGPAFGELFGVEFGDQSKYTDRVESMGWFVVVVLPLTFLAALAFVPEARPAPEPRIRFVDAMRALAQNKAMVRIVLADFLLAFPQASRSAMYVFYVATVVVRPDMISLVLLMYYATQPFSVPFWIWVSRRAGKHKALAYGLFFHALVALCYIIPGEGDILLYVAIHLTSGFVAGGHHFLIRAMVADATDADNVETGQQRSGLFYSLVTTTNKLGHAIGVAIIYPLLQLIGFDPAQGAVNSDEVMDRFLYVYILVPFIAEIPVAWLLYRHPLDEAKQTELRRRIETREAAASGAGGSDR